MKEKQPSSLILVLSLLLLLFVKDEDIHLKFYHHIKEIKKPEEVTVLVNKNNRLPITYVPSDLEKISILYAMDDQYMRKEAKKHFEKLSKMAKSLGYYIVAASTYRNYHYQDKLYQFYVETKGKEAADQCSARPGHSEHQTGLSVDVMGSNRDYNKFASSFEFKWMQENAHHYGFILRYPKGKENVTGFKYEPWHYRYVGKEIATLLYQNNWTLEEYYFSL